MEPNLRASFPKVFFILIASLACLLTASSCIARQRIVANLPDAPTPNQHPNEVQSKPNTDRKQPTLAIVSRRSFFFPDLAHTDKPLSAGQKFLLATDQSVAPSALIVAAMSAGINQARDPGQAMARVGRPTVSATVLRWRSMLPPTCFGTFLLPAVLHHDPRYYVLAHGTFSQRRRLRRVEGQHVGQGAFIVDRLDGFFARVATGAAPADG